ncbi:helix-hairpin-helix domain-containing protein [Methanochimaera problematica]|uniref:helix-hairpin-helix domain-containing protein n=1 Tax=Methanochimaera problematica TaxID=2609417 RepID=UPI00293939FD|nr:hypothetical protein [Methanoplanus sp. FWC-SCC4]
MHELTVFDQDNNKIILKGPGRKGGEGEVLKIKNNDFLCAKIYYKEKLSSTLEQKIRAMVKNPPGENLTEKKQGIRASSIAWPVSLLYSSEESKREFLGFTMPLIDTGLFREAHLYYDPEDRLKTFGGSFSWLYLLTTAFNISFVVSSIHNKGHCIGDMSGSNILVARTSAISIIDCDSFQISDKITNKKYYTKVATGDYLSPEMMGRNFRTEDIDRYYSDLFALGILIFKFLMNGVHPFQATGKAVWELPTTEQKIKEGLFPYSGTFKDVSPPKYAPPYRIIPPDIQELFYRCFVKGHKNPKQRPEASEWANALQHEISHIKKCSSNENHLYAGNLESCPWCELKITGKTNSDLFPPPEKTKKEKIRSGDISGINFPLNFHKEKKPAKIPKPQLIVNPGKLSFDIENNDDETLKILIQNSGDGTLSGTITSEQSWIKINEKSFTIQNKSENTITIKKQKLPSKIHGIKHTGSLLIRSNGGTQKIPVNAGQSSLPLLEVSESRIAITNIEPGKTVISKIEVKNKGNAILTGTIKTDREWLLLSTGIISASDTQSVDIIADTSKMDLKPLHSGHIIIKTNGGEAFVLLALSIKKPI